MVLKTYLLHNLHIIFLLPIVVFGCQTKHSDRIPGFYADTYKFPYNLNSPMKSMRLSTELSRVSGLDYNHYLDQLLGINDNKSNLYVLNQNSGEVINTIEFGKRNDYEGVASIGKMVYIATSSGTIKIIDLEGEVEVGEFNGILSDANIEGLVYDSLSSSILMATKGKSYANGHEIFAKSIFQMNPVTGYIDSLPKFIINLKDEIRRLLRRNITNNLLIDISINARLKKFAPSAIAIHPKNKDIYLLSSSGNLLIVWNRVSHLNAIIFLKKSMHVQPQGICFDKQANLYISNEARGKQAVIYKYQPLTHSQER